MSKSKNNGVDPQIAGRAVRRGHGPAVHDVRGATGADRSNGPTRAWRARSASCVACGRRCTSTSSRGAAPGARCRRARRRAARVAAAGARDAPQGHRRPRPAPRLQHGHRGGHGTDECARRSSRTTLTQGRAVRQEALENDRADAVADRAARLPRAVAGAGPRRGCHRRSRGPSTTRRRSARQRGGRSCRSTASCVGASWYPPVPRGDRARGGAGGRNRAALHGGQAVAQGRSTCRASSSTSSCEHDARRVVAMERAGARSAARRLRLPHAGRDDAARGRAQRLPIGAGPVEPVRGRIAPRPRTQRRERPGIGRGGGCRRPSAQRTHRSPRAVRVVAQHAAGIRDLLYGRLHDRTRRRGGPAAAAPRVDAQLQLRPVPPAREGPEEDVLREAMARDLADLVLRRLETL